MVGQADVSTGSRRPVEAVFWAIVSAPTVSFVLIVPPIGARAIVVVVVVVVVATRIPIVAAATGAAASVLAAASIWAAASVLAAASIWAAASILARPIETRALLFASAVDEVTRCGLLGGSGRFVGELPWPLL